MKEIESPTGIDVEPDPPPVVRLSKRAGIVVLVVVAVVIALIGYGVLTRNQRSLQIGFQFDERKGITAATDAGKVVAAQVPARSVAGTASASDTDELVAPDEPDPSPAPARYYAPPASPPPPQYREPSPEERRLALLFAKEQEAMAAPTSTRSGFAQPAAPAPNPSTDLAQMAALLRNDPQRPATLNLAAPSADDAQSQKEAFLQRARKPATSNYLDSTRTPPASKYEIKAGWDIPAVLEQALNSDLPGEVKALVRENVYDTATGNHLLIPHGARLVGIYDSRIAYGQDGILIAWNRIIYPDGSSIDLEGMSGQDAAGNAGLRHKVDRHYKRLLGFGLLTSVFSAAFQLSQTRRGGLLGYPSSAEIAGSAVGREMSQLGADVTRRNLNVQPTIKVPVGYRFNVRVSRDVLFDRPYRPPLD